jgi:Domain of unknown function (DUF397)
MTWRTSTRSIGNGACVEVADSPSVILVRDTTNRLGTVLELPAYAWQQFTESLR